MNLQKKGVAFQIVLRISILVIATCAILTTVLFFTMKKATENQLISTLEKRAVDAGKLVDKEIQGYIKQTEDIAQRPDIRAMDWNAQREALIPEQSELDLNDGRLATLRAMSSAQAVRRQMPQIVHSIKRLCRTSQTFPTCFLHEST